MVNKKEKRHVNIEAGFIGIESVKGFIVSPEPLLAGQHRTNNTVHLIPLRNRLGIEINGTRRVIVEYSLNPNRVANLYMKPGWLPVRPEQIDDLIGIVGTVYTFPRLARISNVKLSIARASGAIIFRGFDALKPKARMQFLEALNTLCSGHLSRHFPGVFSTISFGIKGND